MRVVTLLLLVGCCVLSFFAAALQTRACAFRLSPRYIRLTVGGRFNRNQKARPLLLLQAHAGPNQSLSSLYYTRWVAGVLGIALSILPSCSMLEVQRVWADEAVVPASTAPAVPTSEQSTQEMQATQAMQPKKLEDEILSIQISPLEKELQDFEEDLEMAALMQRKDSKRLMSTLKQNLVSASKRSSSKSVQLDNAKERVLTLKAYLDEAERDLFKKNWENLQIYLYTFADQEDAFAALIEGLFPNKDPLDASAREAMSFEAQSMFISLDDLREAARVQSLERARGAYSRLLLSYDRFLKAGDLYPTYDPITSTAIFFANTPQSTLRFDALAKVQVLDCVLLTEGPDMGKTGTVINIDGSNAVVKLDKDGKAYQEVKYVRLNMLAKTLDDGTTGERKVVGKKAGV